MQSAAFETDFLVQRLAVATMKDWDVAFYPDSLTQVYAQWQARQEAIYLSKKSTTHDKNPNKNLDKAGYKSLAQAKAEGRSLWNV